MYTLMQTLFGISFLFLVTGLIKPTWILRWGKKKTRLRAAGVCLGLMFLFAGGGNAFEPEEEKQTRQERHRIAKEQEVQKQAEKERQSRESQVVKASAQTETKAGSSQQSKKSKGSKKHTIIRAKVDDFRNDFPLLSSIYPQRIDRDGRWEYHFKNVSSMGQNNFIVLYDDGKDGVIDQINMGLVFDSRNELSQMDSLSIALKTISIASGIDSSKFGEEFGEWFGKSLKKAKKSSVQKWFGDVLVGLSIMEAQGGFSALVTIGEDNMA
jgi:hypothetical protein